jgi:hypothetical protein
VQSIGIVAAREPEVLWGSDSFGAPLSNVRLTFRGLLESRTVLDRDTRIRILVPAVQAARLWRLLGESLTRCRRLLGHNAKQP